MFARWAKNAKAFTKVGREIAIAVKLGGAEPDNNPRLRAAIQAGRSLSMPKDTIEAAVHRAASKSETNYEEVTYEAYAPHGVALFIETATDNTTRTVGNVRSILNRYDGSLGTTGSLSYVFDRKGVFSIKPPATDLDELELDLIDHGLEEFFETEEGLVLYTSFNDFVAMQKALEERKLEVLNASPQRIAKTKVELSLEQEAEVLKLIDALEEDDDVQHVYHTLKMNEEEE